MYRSTASFLTLLLCGCDANSDTSPLTARILEAVQEQQAAEQRSLVTPANIEVHPEWRELLPPDAVFHPYPAMQFDYSWLVPESLAEVTTWYRAEMKRRGFKGSLRQCITGSIWGGRNTIVDYCSDTHYLALSLATDSTLNQSVIAIRYNLRRKDLDCSNLTSIEFKRENSQNCPVELLP
jgi:hypothetical protein